MTPEQILAAFIGNKCNMLQAGKLILLSEVETQDKLQAPFDVRVAGCVCYLNISQHICQIEYKNHTLLVNTKLTPLSHYLVGDICIFIGKLVYRRVNIFNCTEYGISDSVNPSSDDNSCVSVVSSELEVLPDVPECNISENYRWILDAYLLQENTKSLDMATFEKCVLVRRKFLSPPENVLIDGMKNIS
jgi:hypothetical protein